MKDKIGIGFIGTGFARRVQIPAFLMCSGAEVVSVASASLENAESTAKEFEVPHFTSAWRETIDHDDVDLVCITTPPTLHFEQAMYAIAKGKHVLCEKPMAMNSAEAAKMTEAARERGVLALIDHELRFQGGRLKAYQMLRNGEIGTIRHVKYIFRNAQRGNPDVRWNWWSDADQGGGTLGAIGSHAIDTMRWFLGTEISGLFCQMQTHVVERTDSDGNLRAVTTDDETNMILRFNDGILAKNATGNVSLSMIEFPDYQHSIEFVGTLGSMRVLSRGEILLTKAGEGDWSAVDVEIGRSVEGIFDSGFVSGFVAFAEVLVRAIREGKTTVEHAADFFDGLRVQNVLDKARMSSKSGRFVEIDYSE
jgi:predicted dehydrogenase